MLDAVLDYCHASMRTTGCREPQSGRIAVVGLGGNQHPVDRTYLAELGVHAWPGADHAFRRLHLEGIERRARRHGDIVAVILRKPCSQRRADGAGTDEEDGSHGAMIVAR
jgi:hypothetical protein